MSNETGTRLRAASSLGMDHILALLGALAVCVLGGLLAANDADAKEAIAYFGTESGSGTRGGQFNRPGDVAVNSTGAGPADQGEIYIADEDNRRIQRFAQDDNGTPDFPYDDSYVFVSAWGADVDATPDGGSAYEICVDAADCQAGPPLVKDELASSNGALSAPSGIAVDQDTGFIYVLDRDHFRINVYAGDGAFLRSFGWDVVPPGSTNNLPSNEQQTIALGGNTTGGTFSLTVPTGVGTGTATVFSKTIQNVEARSGEFNVGDGITGPGVRNGTVVSAVDAGAKTLSLSNAIEAFSSSGVFRATETVTGIPHDVASTGSGGLQGRLEALPGIEPGDIAVTGPSGGPYAVDFIGRFADLDVQQMTTDPAGLTVSSGAKSAAITTTVAGASYEVCVADEGDVCKIGTSGSGAGQIGSSFSSDQGEKNGIAVTPGDGNSANGSVFITDGGNRRVNIYDLDGDSPGFFGSVSQFPGDRESTPSEVAVDGRGIVYIADRENTFEIDRYDSENANGGGVGFLDSIAAQRIAVGGGPGNPVGSSPYEIEFTGPFGATDIDELVAMNGAVPLAGGSGVSVSTVKPGGPDANEVQQIKVSASVGQFRLTLDGQTTGATFTGDLKAGSEIVTNVTITAGRLVQGEEVSGPGIPAGAKVIPLDANTVFISKAATTTASGVSLAADLPFDATALTVAKALEAIAPASPPPPLSTENIQTKGLEVDPDSDGSGPDKDILYVLRDGGNGTTAVQQFGPVNEPGLAAAPTDDDAAHGLVAGFNFVGGLGFDLSRERFFISSQYSLSSASDKVVESNHGVYVLDDAGGSPSASIDSISDITATSATVHATVEPNGPPDVSYRLEYSLDGSAWTQLSSVVVGSQETPQAVDVVLNPLPAGLEPNTQYQVRLSAFKPFAPSVTTSVLKFTTLAEAPRVETVGAPVRTATTAQLNGRVNPRNKATTYHFEFGNQGPCDANPCQSTAGTVVPAGAFYRLVSAPVADLDPGTTYHYRLVADNGAPGSPVSGDDMTVTTSASDAPLGHGDFPGPPGSDRAYEMVSLPDSGGNPVNADTGAQFSSQGDRAVYSISGGTPISGTGNLLSFYFAERNPSGWATRNITPGRNELVGPTWSSIGPSPDDLSALNIRNISDSTVLQTIWRLSPFGAPVRVFDTVPPTTLGTPGAPLTQVFLTAPESPRVIVSLKLSGAESVTRLYEVGSGAPEAVGLLSGDAEPQCDLGQSGAETARLSSDGQYLVFASQGAGPCGNSPFRIYARDLETGESKLVSPPSLSGQDCGSLRTLRLTTDELFFWTPDRLVAEDTPAATCDGFGLPDGDIYRYDFGASTLECVTCPLASFDVDVEASLGDGGGTNQIAVSRDGSRIYFRSVSSTPLVVGATTGGDSTYVLNAENGQLRWVGSGIAFGQADHQMTTDGSVVLFKSNASSLNPVGGTSDNGGTSQLYRYDDNDRSLVCVSCAQDGSLTSAPVQTDTGISGDGGTIGFTTPKALLGRDQNTPSAAQSPSRGMDVYEWRDGRLFLITDGLTDWASFSEPRAMGISPSGRDIYFTAFAQYTPDALDAYNRLYDARIGGGFEYPEPPVPCPLEVCQGTPKGAPEEAAPGTGAVSGPGNRPSSSPTKARCPKGKRLVRRAGKTRCVKRPTKKSNRKANRDRRVGR